MTDELNILFQDSQEPPMERRATDVMLVLIRQVQASAARTEEALAKVNDKLDKIVDERREEARESGNISARVKSLEDFRKNTEDRRKSDRGIAIGALFTAASALLIMLLRLISKNPDVLK